MPIMNPTQLVDEFKKSGEFDRLRRELLAQFRSSDNYTSFMARVEDVARQKLASDNKVKTLPETSMVKELMQDLNRYPIIERAVTEMEESTLADPDFKAKVRGQVTRILREDRDEKQDIASSQAAADGNHTSLAIHTSAVRTIGTSPGTQSLGMQNGMTSKDDSKSEMKPENADGNESEDSAMLESPVSEVPQNEDKPPFN